MLVERGVLDEAKAFLPLMQRWDAEQRVKQRLLRLRAQTGGSEGLLMGEDGAYHQADPFDLTRAAAQALTLQAIGGRTWEDPS